MSRKVVAYPLILLAALAPIGVFLLTLNDSAEASVEIRENGKPVGSASLADAVAETSQKVGFEVIVPAELPAQGLRILYVDADLGPGVPEVTAPLKTATLVYGRPDRDNLRIVIEQTGVRFGSPEGRAEKLDLGVPGVDAYRQETDRVVGYWMLTESRGWLIAVTGDQRPSDEAITKMLRSLLD